MTDLVDEVVIKHHGIKGQKWGQIRDLQDRRRAIETLKSRAQKVKEQGKSANAKRREGKVGSSTPATAAEIAAANAAAAAAAAELADAEKEKEETPEEKIERLEKELKEKKGKGGGAGAGADKAAAKLAKEKKEREKEKKRKEEERKAEIAERTKAAEDAKHLTAAMIEEFAGNTKRSPAALLKEADSIGDMVKMVGDDKSAASTLKDIAARARVEAKGGAPRSREQLKADAEYVAKMSERFASEVKFMNRKKDVKHGDLLSELLTTEPALSHSGVKGMKWGVRKDDNATTAPSSEKKASDLTDSQLKTTVNRLNMEKQYKTMMKEKADEAKSASMTKSDKAREYIKALAKKQAENSVNNLASFAVNLVVDTKIKPIIKKKIAPPPPAT